MQKFEREGREEERERGGRDQELAFAVWAYQEQINLRNGCDMAFRWEQVGCCAGLVVWAEDMGLSNAAVFSVH